MLGLISKLVQGIKLQEEEDREMLHLAAYDNQMSELATSFLSSRLSFRYNLGTLENNGCCDPARMGEFLFKGMPYVFEFEKAAQKAASRMFHSVTSDFRPLSGMHAMMSTICAVSNPGDTIYSVECDYGGHFATSHVAKKLGRRPLYIPMDPSTLSIDMDKFAKMIKKDPPNLVYFDIGCALFPIPVAMVRDLVGASIPIIYDASHTQGLIAGGEFQSPLEEGADIIQGNTHKTFPGPQKGMIHFKDDHLACKVKDALTSGLVSSQQTHHSIALYMTIMEMYHFGGDYARQMISNASALARFLKREGIELVEVNGIPTKSNVILIKGDQKGGHVEACRRLYGANIATNSRHGYGLEVIRIGVQEATRRGMKEKDMEAIAYFIRRLIKDKVDPERFKKEVIAFNRQFNRIHYSFDDLLS